MHRRSLVKERLLVAFQVPACAQQLKCWPEGQRDTRAAGWGIQGQPTLAPCAAGVRQLSCGRRTTLPLFGAPPVHAHHMGPSPEPGLWPAKSCPSGLWAFSLQWATSAAISSGRRVTIWVAQEGASFTLARTCNELGEQTDGRELAL